MKDPSPVNAMMYRPLSAMPAEDTALVAKPMKIQCAVEGFSVIAISHYLLGILKMTFESSEHAGLHVSPLVMLVSMPS